MWPFKRKTETRSATNTGYTSQMIQARTAYITGTDGRAELTSTVQAAVSLWENGLSVADVEGTDLLSKRTLGITGRMLALRGEALFYVADEALIPVSDWDLSTRLSRPSAYRLTLPEIGGARTVTALAAEVLHFRIGVDALQPWFGTAPLKRASLSADLLEVIERGLVEVYGDAPLGSSIVPMPESKEVDLADIARGFRGSRGRVLVRESVQVQAAGGPAPAQDWKANDLTPDLSKAQMDRTLDQAREQINAAFGILPALNNQATTGPMVREAQRHLAQWTLQPIAEGIAEECTDKLGAAVALDVMRPLQAFDAGGRARAAMGVIQALAAAKEAGVDPAPALKLVDW
jgi:phage portal protein BeeE